MTRFPTVGSQGRQSRRCFWRLFPFLSRHGSPSPSADGPTFCARAQRVTWFVVGCLSACGAAGRPSPGAERGLTAQIRPKPRFDVERSEADRKAPECQHPGHGRDWARRVAPDIEGAEQASCGCEQSWTASALALYACVAARLSTGEPQRAAIAGPAGPSGRMASPDALARLGSQPDLCLRRLMPINTR